jgi:small subunit ribosomal protein S17
MEERTRASAKTREGLVVSSAMNKTVVVAVKRTVRHSRYRKYLQTSTKYLAHDERNECSVGDRVVIAESRPLSKRKRWRLQTIVERAVRDVPEVDEIA